MSEVLSLHVGQAGIQVGNACWELFCHEHDIDKDGSRPGEPLPDEHDGHLAFFAETHAGKFTPRSVCVDLEPAVVDEVRCGAFRELYHPDQLISGKEGAASNYARGRYTVGKELIGAVMDRVRRAAEQCTQLQGFLLFHSVGGGTGAGFGSLLLEQLATHFPAKSRMAFSVFPSPHMATAVVEPYNSVLASQALIEHTDVCTVLDNEALYDMCGHWLDIERPSYVHTNHIISHLVSSLTASIRFRGSLNATLDEFRTNLVPYRIINFVLGSYAPLTSKACSPMRDSPTMEEITNVAFEPSSVMAKCDPRLGKYMSCCLMYRGDVTGKDISSVFGMMKTKRTIEFVDWCPTGLKCGLNTEPPTAVPGSGIAPAPRTLCMISNSTAIDQKFTRINRAFDSLLAKRAFVFWYVSEGFEEGEFTEAREYMAALQLSYRNFHADAAHDDDGDDDDDTEAWSDA